jgi:hypothetical protein
MSCPTAGRTATLICLARLAPEFSITAAQMEAWYGISAETAHKGLAELVNHKVLTTWTTTRPDPRSPQGYTYLRHYRFKAPYDRGRTAAEVAELEGLPDWIAAGTPSTAASA